MKKRRVWRYTCEHCKKSGCHAGHMRDHELRCFKNPARKCPVCCAKWPIAKLAPHFAALADVNETTEPAVIEALSFTVDGCPACILSTIKQAELPVNETEFGPFFPGDEPTIHRHRYWIRWDYKKARGEYREETQREENSQRQLMNDCL
jgi:hypothetical protein